MIKKCLICNKEFKTKPCQIKIGWGKFCSWNCYHKSRIGIKLSEKHIYNLKISHKGLKIWLGRKHTKETKDKLREYRGEKSPHWKGGITSLWQMIRELPETIQWRLEVFKRDNYICQKCGDNSGGNLNAHHIKPFQKILNEFLQYYFQFSPLEEKSILARLAITYEPFWDVNNGITLCENCHKNARQKLLNC